MEPLVLWGEAVSQAAQESNSIRGWRGCCTKASQEVGLGEHISRGGVRVISEFLGWCIA